MGVRSPRIEPIFSDHLDDSNDLTIELVEVLGRDPVLLMVGGADGVDFIPSEKIGLYGEPRYVANVSRCVVPDVPLLGDLGGVSFIQDGVEDRLSRETRRELPKAASSDEVELALSNRSV